MNGLQFRLHSFPFYIADWRDSETRLEFTAEQRGLYLDAITWLYQEGSLPSERRKLIAILACTEEEFDRSWPAVEAKFIKRADGRLEHAKVNEVLAKLASMRIQKAEAGRASGAKRGAAAKRSTNGRSTRVQHPLNTRSRSRSTDVAPSPASTPASLPQPSTTSTSPAAGQEGAPLSVADGESYETQFRAALLARGFRNPDSEDAEWMFEKVSEVCRSTGVVPTLGAVIVADLLKKPHMRDKSLDYMLAALRDELKLKNRRSQGLRKVVAEETRLDGGGREAV